MTTETKREKSANQAVATENTLNGLSPESIKKEDPATLLQYYRMMVLIRKFEERSAEMYTKARIGGYCHLNLGEEATIVGLMAALRPEDYIFTNYREHGYILARGAKPGPVMAELFGKETGVSKGRGGSMHLFDVNLHFMGGYGIVGGQLPLATGAGLALKYKEKDGMVVAQMGDATTNIGAFHESLNLARIWNLPVMFLVINNGYGMGTKVESASAEPELYKRAAGYNIVGERVDGKDPLAVRDAVRRAIERAKNGEPTLLEAVSHRFKGHSVVDPDRYRDPEMVKTFRQSDPLFNFARVLEENGILTPEQDNKLQEEVDQEVQEAIDFAEQSPTPAIETMFDFMYATSVANEIDPQWAQFKHAKEAK
ncbi:MAG: pyruvate dehydrogenase (acetyl-transferring) component, alpha subunit [Chloroflexi bacterium]|jgi:pyruvate dehydrogenase E1 component alpha subunit|nr:pyruvate dehydrogenase (acetyl-transferring) component, alpha subunit [Chloroflexota bacterium]